MSSRKRPSLISAVFILAIPLLTGAKGAGCGGEVSLGDDKGECPTSACGAMDAIACADGKSPYTGKCLAKTDGTCAWETRSCGGTTTPPECSPCIVDAIACADGSSPYGDKCYLDSAGTCTAPYKGCGGTSTSCSDCAIPDIACADGKSPYSGKCIKNPEGSCVAQFIGCGGTTTSCTDAECGPVPPVAPCTFGGGPSIACNRHPDGVCSWDVGTCKDEACTKVTSLGRACSTAADCAYGLHQIDCCGAKQAIGYSKSASGSFSALEKECVGDGPVCDCIAGPTKDDSGKPGTEFGVGCNAGVCTSYAITGI